MDESHHSFDLMPDIRTRMPRVKGPLLPLWRRWYQLKGLLRPLRVSRPLTGVLGPQHRRSRTMIEIDITYACNLLCHNCNRSCAQAPEALHMPLSMIRRFVQESEARSKRWKRIRVLGGEPTLHPEFPAVVEVLHRYSQKHPGCVLEVVTNGHGPQVQGRIARLPADVLVDNSAKTSRVQPDFGPFNLAPVDDLRFSLADFCNGCFVMRDCGMGLTPLGYYPCAVAGGIDRILGAGLGGAHLPPDDDDMLEAARRLCGLCGRFRDGHFVPRVLRPELRRSTTSRTWRELYARWHPSAGLASGDSALPTELDR